MKRNGLKFAFAALAASAFAVTGAEARPGGGGGGHMGGGGAHFSGGGHGGGGGGFHGGGGFRGGTAFHGGGGWRGGGGNWHGGRHHRGFGGAFLAYGLPYYDDYDYSYYDGGGDCSWLWQRYEDTGLLSYKRRYYACVD